MLMETPIGHRWLRPEVFVNRVHVLLTAQHAEDDRGLNARNVTDGLTHLSEAALVGKAKDAHTFVDQ
ncbi:hypothetical protein D3C80_2136490 [compost metagenome]